MFFAQGGDRMGENRHNPDQLLKAIQAMKKIGIKDI